MIRNKMMLHICCAPDATVPVPVLLGEGYSLYAYFFGGNIHPEKEYRLREEMVQVVCGNYGVPLILGNFEEGVASWMEKTHRLASDPEGGKRCALCIAMQLVFAARCAEEKGCAYLCSTLTISPHKDPDRINNLGERIAVQYGLLWINRVWRKNDGFKRSIEESRKLGLYRQNYCGCLYSMKEEKDCIQ